MDFDINLNPRDRALHTWLTSLTDTHQLKLESMSPASSDASFRRYYRLDSGRGTVIAMDAPPEREDSRPFVLVTRKLQRTGLNVPDILAQDLDQGFLLLTDLGTQTYYHAVQNDLDDVRLQKLYRDAIAALVSSQTTPTDNLPHYNQLKLY